MKKTRRSFLQMLAAIPLVGPALAELRPAPSGARACYVPETTFVNKPAESIYGFDERFTLKELYGGGRHQFIAGQELRRGDFVCVKNEEPLFSNYFQVVKCADSDHPVGIVTASVHEGGDVGDSVLFKGWVSIKAV